ncbi:MFS general substrate transporter [Cryphonectria parasitica EP155]|uniref:MFS general substrate transporter n=1 Tax=Cryphonectria parasitica (strain ATCC 38755 / EP155) TaxID=660469 RepID=A0A9P4YDV4_CRYP1|nr:MFS general substrate transporter [Cryphonectria parasitica EP155]KAF3770790.1 MFS general substrate transporter [Cryphonectria parasitica EP155]
MAPSVEHELRQIRRPAAATTWSRHSAAEDITPSSAGARPGTQQPAVPTTTTTTTTSPPSPPWLRLKIFGVAFSFFCAGINDSTLGPLVPYMLTSFSIGTGQIAILYASSFIGWFLAAITNPLLTPHLTLGQLLCLGAAVQLVAQCLRPWSPFPLFCVTFALQALGTGYQDAHGNTFVSGVRLAHRWLGLIHAMYALALVMGPLVATSIAAHPSATGRGVVGGSSSWRRTYFVTLGVNLVNLAWVMVAFRDSLGKIHSETARGRADGSTAWSALRDMGVMLKVKDVWLISLFFFFALGASMTSSGWVVDYLVDVRGGRLSKVGYVPTGYSAGLFLGRLLLPEPTYRFGEKRALLVFFAMAIGFQLVFWLVPNVIADATALSVQGFFLGPFFATGVSVASKIFPRKIQAAALSFVFVVAQAGAAIFPSITGLIAEREGVQVLQPMILAQLIAATIFWGVVPKATERRE